MKTLKPVEVSDFYIRQVASGMAQYFWGFIFAPIFEIIQENTVENSTSDLITAIKSGKVWYDKGAFRTDKRFSNKVSKTLEDMGAKFVRGSYKIDITRIPSEVLSALNVTKILAVEKATRISDFLLGALPLLKTFSIRDFIEVAVEKMYKKLELDILKSAKEYELPVIELGVFTPDVNISRKRRKEIETYWKERDEQAGKLREKVKEATSEEEKEKARQKLSEFQADTFENAPRLEVNVDEYELNEVSRKIAEDYVYNMNYWVKKWEVKNIIEMRKEVADMVQKGVRTPQLQVYFEKRWKIAKNKAKFLAENESRLAGSVIKATQYQDLGCTQFKWGRSVALEKRELHKHYYNKIFDFNDPPIIDEKLGIKGLPQQIWNCQCQMLCVSPTLAQVLKKKDEVQNAKRNVIELIKYRIRNSKQRSNSNWRYRRYGQG